MTDESAKKAILARRARVIAAAVVGAGLVSCERNQGDPTVCLSIAAPTNAEPPPMPCLSPVVVPRMPPDAGASANDAGPAGGPSDELRAADAGRPSDAARPLPPAPEPAACLSWVPHKD